MLDQSRGPEPKLNPVPIPLITRGSATGTSLAEFFNSREFATLIWPPLGTRLSFRSNGSRRLLVHYRNGLLTNSILVEPEGIQRRLVNPELQTNLVTF